MIINKNPMTLRVKDTLSGINIDYVLHPMYDKCVIDAINKYDIPIGFVPHEYIGALFNFNVEWSNQWKRNTQINNKNERTN